MCVCVCVYVGGFAVDALILSHFPWGEYAYVLFIHLGAFDFQNGRFGNQMLKQILEEGSRHPYFSTLSFGEMSLRSPNSAWSF